MISAISVLIGLGVALALVQKADGAVVHSYLLSNWAAPFGIALALDRLTALMLLLTSILACVSLLYAMGGDDKRGKYFHCLFQFQLMGLNGAFLTADIFNLFVFFEVLLICSYGLLLHGGGARRLSAAVHYVTFNLAGSALFLISASLLYGLTGTLNMADMAERIAHLPGDRSQLVQSAALLLVVVFCVKAALLPLYFWLPATYGAASAPVAALFAVMTKVGVYAVLRVTTLIFGAQAGAASLVASPWLEWLALGTLLLGVIGAFAAKSLAAMIGNMVVASAGTLMLAIGLARVDTVAAGLFYLVNSTLVAAALFLLADRIVAARQLNNRSLDQKVSNDSFEPAELGAARIGLGVLFVVFAVAAAGMPPLAGFLGKAMLLKAAGPTTYGGVIVGIVLASSLLMMVTFARSGSMLFWRPVDAVSLKQALASASIVSSKNGESLPVQSRWVHQASIVVLAILVIACSIFAADLSRYTNASAVQLFEREPYIQSVLQAKPVPPAFDVRKEMRNQKPVPIEKVVPSNETGNKPGNKPSSKAGANE